MLANEQVVDGACERCGTAVTKKSLTQWYFKITDYADRLLDDMDELRGHWPERVLAMQRNWIGRSEGAHVDFVIEADGGRPPKDVTVFTTRPDTLYGATFFVVAADAHAGRRTGHRRARARRWRPTATGQGAVRDRTPVHRAREDRRLHRPLRDQPAQRREAARSGPPTTSWPTTARAPSWPSRRTTSATSTSPRPSTCPCAPCWTPARRPGRVAARPPPAKAR